MAEIVEKNIQATVPEVEEMERTGLMLKKELRVLIEKRREFEYRLIRCAKNKEDFYNYINYEKKLLALLKIRRKQMRMSEKFQEIEGVIRHRIVRRCRTMTRLWPHHLDTWALRVNFSREIGWKGEVTIAYAEQVRHHGNSESLYVSWAKFEIEDRNNFDFARKILLSKASLYHSKSILIKRELFRLELLYVESLIMKQKEDKAITEVIAENREKVLSGEVARVVFASAVKEIPDPQLYLELYQIADNFEYEFAQAIREEIYRDLVKAFPDSECTWKLKAQRTVKGIEVVSIKEGEEEAKEGEEKAPSNLLAIDKLNNTISIYDEALSAIGPTFLKSYFEELMLMLFESWSIATLNDVILEKITALCESNESSLLPEHYIIWFDAVRRKPDSGSIQMDVLEKALTAYPDLGPLQLEYFKKMLMSDLTYKNKMQRFEELSKKMKGRLGIQIWEEVLQRIHDRKRKMQQYRLACNHVDDGIAMEFRIRYLQWLLDCRPVERARAMYLKYGMRPPFSAKMHAIMIIGELTKNYGLLPKARLAFENAIISHGKVDPGLWLAFIYFEKYAGEPLKAGALYTRAEKELTPKKAEIFRQLSAMVAEKIKKSEDNLNKNTSSTEPNVVWVTAGGKGEVDELVQNTPVVSLFEDTPIITYSVDQERKAFFGSINEKKKMIDIDNQSTAKEDESVWEDVLEKLIGERVPLVIERVTFEKETRADEETSLTAVEKLHKAEEYMLSDKLEPGTDPVVSKGSNVGEIEKILESSFTLKPEFQQQTKLSPYYVGKKQGKAIRRKERSETKGPGWYDMKAPEMTKELKRDLQVLQMRSVVDPKRPFKNKDLQVLPKHFQMGTIVDSPIDFYSSRVPMKKRKRTMAEEIMNDEDSIRYHKQKYNEIISQKRRFHSKHKSSKVKKPVKGKGKRSDII